MSNRNASKMLLLIAVGVPALVAGFSSVGQAGLVITSRYSEVFYNTTNLTDGVTGPPSTQTVNTTSPSVTFHHTLFDTFDHITVTGAHNTGSVYVFQMSIVSATDISAETSQAGFVETDSNSPAIYTRSRFIIQFQVTSPMDITLDGLVDGSSIVGASNFARVLLSRNGGPIFITSSSGSFASVHGLSPGFTYALEVESAGIAFAAVPFTPSFVETSSRASAELKVATTDVIPEPASWLLMAGGWGLLYVIRTQKCQRKVRPSKNLVWR